MKTLWARIGRTYEVDDETYKKICKAVKEEDSRTVATLLEACPHYDDGDNYLPYDCEDNPNEDDDFEF